ncbi:MAG: hypothetical protein ACREQ9_03625 [Candidatus Binatia bacterium]
MSRIERVLTALILVAATVLVTEWVHYRLGDPVLWRVLEPELPDGSAVVFDEFGNPTVTESEFQRYVEVLGNMQGDRDLSIDDAVGGVELTLGEFRDIEQRVQRNEALVQRARELLRKKAESLWDSRRATLEHG